MCLGGSFYKKRFKYYFGSCTFGFALFWLVPVLSTLAHFIRRTFKITILVPVLLKSDHFGPFSLIFEGPKCSLYKV